MKNNKNYNKAAYDRLGRKLIIKSNECSWLTCRYVSVEIRSPLSACPALMPISLSMQAHSPLSFSVISTVNAVAAIGGPV